MSNTTLKGYESPDSKHTDWDNTKCWWDISNSAVRMNYGSSLDQPLTSQGVIPGATIFVVFRCVLEDPDAYVPETTSFYCGFYGEQNGQWDWLKGSTAVSSTISGEVLTPATRYYQIVTSTNRGYASSSEITPVTNAPSEEDFQNGARVTLTWPRAARLGVTGYDIYRFTVAGLIEDITGSVFTVTEHMLESRDWVVLVPDEGAALPGNLTANTPYKIEAESDDTFTLLDSSNQPITPTAGWSGDVEIRKIQLLFRTERNNNYYVDNDSFLESDPFPYPSIEFIGEKALSKTIPGALVNIATVGQPWTVVPLAVNIPENFSPASMAKNPTQWFRLFLQDSDPGRTGLDIRLPVIANYDTSAYVVTEGGFNEDWIGKIGVVTGYDQTAEAEITSVIYFEGDPRPYIVLDEVGGTWDDPQNTGVPVTMTIKDAATPNNLLIDLAYAGYADVRTALTGAFHPEDLAEERGQWRSRPTSQNRGNVSNTGGSTDDGDDGGPITTCVAYDEMVISTDGMGAIFQIAVEDLEEGHLLLTHNSRITMVQKATWYDREIWKVETANGFSAEVSSTHKFITHEDDEDGTHLNGLLVGDFVLTCIDGENELSPIAKKTRIGIGPVVGIELTPDKRFICGKWEKGVCRHWGGIVSHNKIAPRPSRPPVEG